MALSVCPAVRDAPFALPLALRSCPALLPLALRSCVLCFGVSAGMLRGGSELFSDMMAANGSDGSADCCGKERGKRNVEYEEDDRDMKRRREASTAGRHKNVRIVDNEVGQA